MTEQVPEATDTNTDEQPALDDVANGDADAGGTVEVDESGEQKG